MKAKPKRKTKQSPEIVKYQEARYEYFTSGLEGALLMYNPQTQVEIVMAAECFARLMCRCAMSVTCEDRSNAIQLVSDMINGIFSNDTGN